MLILGLKGFRSVKLLSLKVIKLTDLCRVGTVSVRVKFRDFGLATSSLYFYVSHAPLNLVSYLILKPFFQQCRWVLYSLTVLHPKLKETVYGIFAYIKLNIIVFSFSSQYYQGLNLPEEELKKRLKHCSRHRARFSPPPSTPPGFWNLSFPDTQEYMDKGYLKTASEVPAPKRLRRTRRNRIAK